jgi:hypothetical protein
MCYSYDNVLITNCLFYNNTCVSGEDETHSGSSITAWGFGTGGTSGLTIDHCTILQSQGIVVGEDNGNAVNTTIRYCYADFTPTTDVTNVTFLSSGTNTTTTATPGNSIHHNIIISGGPRDSIGYSSEQGAAPEAFYNNTWVRNSSNLGYRYVEASGFSALVTAYNNLMYDNGVTSSTEYGYMSGNVDVFALCDYNIYGTLMGSPQFSTYASGSAGGATSQTFATWKTAIGSKDAHSSQNATNPFTNAGTYALQYTVASGSPAYQTGKVGGLSSGATCNVGAWDGTVTQIGSTLPVPGTTP